MLPSWLTFEVNIDESEKLAYVSLLANGLYENTFYLVCIQ